MKKAKIKAVEEGITLKEFLIKCMEKELSESSETGKEEPWKVVRGKGSADKLEPEDSGFEGYSGPDWNHSVQVNEPSE